MGKKRKIWNDAVKAALYAAAFLTGALLVGISGFIGVRGVPFLTGELLTTQTSYIRDTIGILPNILNTLYIILCLITHYIFQ